MVSVRVPATSANLGPGFDTLGMALSIFNEVHLEESDKKLEIKVFGEGSQSISRGEDNLVYISISKVFEKLHRKPSNLRIILKNEIPLARGLGSSSAAIVGGLIAANVYLGNPLTETELLELAIEIEGHPDNVTPAMFGGVVICGIFEGKPCYVKLPVPNFHVILAIPDFELKTSDARRILPDKVPFEDARFNVNRLAFLTAALCLKEYHLLKMMEDRMHQPYRARFIPGFEKVCEAAKEAGALGVALSGSGPTVIAFAKERVVGEVMKKTFSEYGVNVKIILTYPAIRGAIDNVKCSS